MFKRMNRFLDQYKQERERESIMVMSSDLRVWSFSHWSLSSLLQTS